MMAGRLARSSSSGLWVFLAVLCQTTIARLMSGSSPGALQIQITKRTLSETEYDQNNLLYVDIKVNSTTKAELWTKVLQQLSNLTQTRPTLDAVKFRHKRYVFGKDNRVRVRTAHEAQMYPFSTVVLLSVGCTGTLVGMRHVLTAAHCIHDGSKYLKAPRHLRIGSLNSSEQFQWMRVETTFIPKQWKAKIPRQRKLKYDFAILRLKRQHTRPTMALKPCDLKPGSNMQFAGFHGDKWFKSLWYSQCTVFKKNHGMIFNFCDGSKGVSGSGVYVKTDSRLKNAVVGIVTAIGRAKVDGKELKFNIVNSLTRHKINKISKWMTKS